jgi:uncharacterized protein YbjT (DUF2867 family)
VARGILTELKPSHCADADIFEGSVTDEAFLEEALRGAIAVVYTATGLYIHMYTHIHTHELLGQSD